MSNKVNISEKSEKLKEKLFELRNELLSVLDKWFYLVNTVQPRIMFQYDSLFGDLESEIDDKLKIAHLLERKSQLINTRIRSGEKISKNTIEFINQVVEKEVEIVSRNCSNNYRTQYKANNSYQYQNDYFYFSSKKQKTSYQGFSYINSKERASKRFSAQVPCLEKENISTCYRSIVKKLHPDVSESKELFEKHWNNIQTAYKTKDEHRINLYYWSLCLIDEIVEKHKESELLKIAAEQFQNELFREKQSLENASKQEPYNLEDKLSDAFWIIRRKRQLRDKIFQIDRQIIRNKHLLQNMVNNHSLYHSIA